jgi:hypothetical protein
MTTAELPDVRHRRLVDPALPAAPARAADGRTAALPDRWQAVVLEFGPDPDGAVVHVHPPADGSTVPRAEGAELVWSPGIWDGTGVGVPLVAGTVDHLWVEPPPTGAHRARVIAAGRLLQDDPQWVEALRLLWLHQLETGGHAKAAPLLDEIRLGPGGYLEFTSWRVREIAVQPAPAAGWSRIYPPCGELVLIAPDDARDWPPVMSAIE